MSAVVDVVLPVFGIVLLSYGLTRGGVFSASTSEGLTRFMFYAAVPAMLFHTLATTELPRSVPWDYITAFYGGSFIIFVAGAVIARTQFGWPKREAGIAAVSASYSNMVMLGLPLTIAAFGDAGAIPLFILLAFQSTLIFPATTWMIEVYGRDRSASRPNLFVAGAKLLANPVILSLVLGVLANIFSLPIGGPFKAVLNTIGAAAPACGLVALGTGLAQYEVRGELKESSTFVLLKGLAHPALVWLLCWLLHIAPPWTQVAVILAAMPTGINAFIFARNYDLKVGVVSKTIVLSTIVSMITVSLLLNHFLG